MVSTLAPARQDGHAIAAWENEAPLTDDAFLSEEDERLVVLAKFTGCLRARNELLLRYYALAGRLIAKRGRRYRLSWADIEDAHHQSVFWILEAVSHYQSDATAQPYGCRFRSFLHRVLCLRLIDYVRGCSRRKRSLDPSGDGLACDNGHNAGVNGSNPPRFLEATTPFRDEPCQCAQRHELRRRVTRIVERLDRPAREVWELTTSDGLSLRCAAGRLGVSYDAAKRCRHKVLVVLRRELAYLENQE
jgi:RNA polymerase sigma factor (sigma-70 family)